MAQLQNRVGLFGSIRGPSWREAVVARLEQEGIAYFNPIVEQWTPEYALEEAHHLATDRVILFVITKDSKSFGSLAESGWAALSALKNGQNLFLVIQDYAAEQPVPGRKRLSLRTMLRRSAGYSDDDSAANRSRHLVRAHAAEAGIRVYDNLSTAVEAVVELFRQEN